jgi:hypothetical protein
LLAKTLVAIAKFFRSNSHQLQSPFFILRLMIGEESTLTTKRLVQVDEGQKTDDNKLSSHRTLRND